jgi:hypothetical protein
MGMQISCDIHPKLSAQGDVRMDTQRARADHAGVAQQKESEVEEGHLMADHVHMMLSIPPKYSVSGVNEHARVSKLFLWHSAALTHLTASPTTSDPSFALVIGHCLAKLLGSVHDEPTLSDDGLIDRPAANQ